MTSAYDDAMSSAAGTAEPAGTAPNPMIEQVRQYVALAREKARADADRKKINQEMEAIEAALLPQFAASGMQNCNVDDATVYVGQRLYAGAVEGQADALVSALVSIGAGDLVKPKINSNTLSAWVGEQEKDALGQPILPPEIAPLVKLTQEFSLRVLRK